MTHSLLSLLLIALDQTILGEHELLTAGECILIDSIPATALPRIASVCVSFFPILDVRLISPIYRILTRSPSKAG
jgi:hypothetical protein